MHRTDKGDSAVVWSLSMWVILLNNVDWLDTITALSLAMTEGKAARQTNLPQMYLAR
jgi:hypothetical protein